MAPLLVLTAANSAQAGAFRAQLAARRDLPEWVVVPDPRGARVGSGGSTLAVLFALARRFATPRSASIAGRFEGRTVYIVHSGGDARRLPMFAAQGKVFTPLPAPPGEPLDILDFVLRDLHSLRLDGGRVVVAAGDLLLNLGASPVQVKAPGLVGVACRASMRTASRHGVYITDRAGRVTDFLQKPDRTLAARRGAISRDGTLLVDTGILVLDPPTVERWLRAAGAVVRAGEVHAEGALRAILGGTLPTLDLYQHILMAACSDRSEAELIRDFPTMPEPLLRTLYRELRPHGATLLTLPGGDFLHLGTSREYYEALTNPTARQARILGRPTSRLRLINSTGRPRAPGGTAVVDSSRLSSRVRLRGENILAGLPSPSRLDLLPGWCLVVLPIGRSNWAAACCGIDDDLKTTAERGGTFGNRAMTEQPAFFLSAWRAGEERTLWTARLWRVGSLEAVLADAALAMQGRPLPSARRLSFAALLRRVSHARLVALRQDAARSLRLQSLPARALADRYRAAAELAADAASGADRRAAAAALRRAAAKTKPLGAARLHAIAAEVLSRDSPSDHEKEVKAAFACVARAVERGVRPATPRPAAVRLGSIIVAESPVRIDLAGGWSDTPPICHEAGGMVVNAAISLNSRSPIRAAVRLIDEPVIRIVSLDLRRECTLRAARDLRGYDDPRRWDALPKAALILAGIASAARPLARRLDALGGGLEITLDSALPKGSGLGSSSVLAATLFAALRRLRGESVSPRSLVEGAAVLEQMMRTGGGWQDQAGGITPGIKLLTTRPGTVQVPTVEALPLKLWTKVLAPRTLLYFTGVQRMARDILRGVVRAWLAGEPRLVRSVEALHRNAAEMAAALRAGDADAFTRQLAAYWSLKRAIDPGATDARIEAIVESIAPLLDAHSLTGAGGGGFLLLVAKDERAAARVRRRLASRPARRGAAFFDFAVDEHGLRVCIESATEDDAGRRARHAAAERRQDRR